MSDLGSRGFGNNLRISSPQVEIFRLSPGIEPGNGKGDNLGLQAREPNGGSVGLYHSADTAKSFTSLGYTQLDKGAGRQIWKCLDPLNCVAPAAF